MLPSRIRSAFLTWAKRFEVTEHDLLTLEKLGVVSCESFYWKVPNPELLEKFLEQRIWPSVTTRITNGDLESSVREDMPLEDWLLHDDAGAVRRLWEASKDIAKIDLKVLIEDRSTKDQPRKITLQVYKEMCAQATERGMPTMPERHRPGLLTLSRVVSNIRQGGDFEWLSWELFVSYEDEKLAMRTGYDPKKLGMKLVQDVDTGILVGEKPVPDIRHVSVTNEKDLTTMMEIRAFSTDITNTCEKKVYDKLRERYLHSISKVPVLGFRQPTLGEVRVCDRLLHETIYEYVSAGTGMFQDGVEYYTGAGFYEAPCFEMLKHVPSSLPDRSIEKQPVVKVVNADAAVTGSQSSRDVQVCDVCGQKKEDHPNGRWCLKRKVPPNAPSPAMKKYPKAPSRPPVMSASASKGKSKGKGKRGEKAPRVPDHMKDAAHATPDGSLTFCYDFHNETKGCRSGKCGRSHACPFVLADGTICMKDDSPLFSCKHR